MATIPSFKDMPLWQRAVRLAVDVLNVTTQLPPELKSGLGTQLQEAALDIPTLLASGSKAGKQGFQTSLLRSRQSAAELETLLLIIKQAYPATPIDDMLIETHDMQTALTAAAKRLQGQAQPQAPKAI